MSIVDFAGGTPVVVYPPATVIATSGASQALAGGGEYIITLTANCTFTVTWPSGSSTVTITLKQNGTGGWTSTFTGVKWTSGVAPTLRTAANDIALIQIYSPDGGTTVLGSLGGDAFA